MLKVAVYGCGLRAEAMLSFFKKRKICIKYFILTDPKKDFFHDIPIKSVYDIDFNDFDYLILSSTMFYDEMLNELKKSPHYCKAVDMKIKNAVSFLDLFFGDSYYRSIETEDGLNFIFPRTDDSIGLRMAYSGITWSAEMMEKAFSFVHENQTFRSNGIFLDIGANIGTTSLYIKHRYPESKIIAFEPGSLSFNLLRCNCILNGYEDIRLENYGLGKKDSEAELIVDKRNLGLAHIANDSGEGEKIKITSLDTFITANRISSSDISFIWMDVEGYEAEVVLGSQGTGVFARGIPFVQEFNPDIYLSKGNFELYCQEIKKGYSYFVDMRQNGGKIPIEYLQNYGKELSEKVGEHQSDLLFI